MEKIQIRQFKISNASARKRNLTWELAEVQAKYLGVKTPYIMKLFKKFGEKKVLSEVSYVKDLSANSNRYACLMWKLKDDTKLLVDNDIKI